jgi:N-methylhydantoinase A
MSATASMAAERKNRTVRIGADVGGTFTDVVLIDDNGAVFHRKVPSTPPDFERAVLTAIESLLPIAGVNGDRVGTVAHGTTVATNAVLEQRGARTALVTTAGFRDVLELRRIRAPRLYDLFFEKPPPLVPRYLRLEVDERTAVDGEKLIAPRPEQLAEIAKRLKASGAEAIAVCLLHSYAHPDHEQRVTAYLRERLPDVPISASHEVLRERREYERTATTVVNAYVRPVMESYLDRMRQGLERQKVSAPLLIMQSAGGLTPAEDARLRPVFVLESGPAAGVLAASHRAKACGISNLITFDMGGTTAKASLIENGKWHYSPEYEVGASLSVGNRLVGGAGEVIRAQTIDIAEVGAGGGSIALLDRAGGLRVGPQSAGSMPGPVCYGRGGTQATLTDANTVLGYLRSGELADGQVKIDAEAARRVIHDQIAKPLGLSVEEAADGIHRIANARTMRALRAVSIERGRDPREFALMAFGGAGPIHAARLAAELQSPTVIVPPLPGLFSALGLLMSGVEHHAARSCQLSGDLLTPAAVSHWLEVLRSEMLEQFRREGFANSSVVFVACADVRYRGQTSEVQIDIPADAIDQEGLDRALAAFEDEHERLYGHRSQPGCLIEMRTIRLIGRGPQPESALSPAGSEKASSSRRDRDVWFGKQLGRVKTPVISRAELSEPAEGPLLIDEYDATTLAPPGVHVHRDEFGNIVMRWTKRDATDHG